MFPAEAVVEAREAGQRDFGESRQQEAAVKIAKLPADLKWHFIGTLQRNKVRKVLQDFSVLHSVGSLRLARHIDRIAREMNLKPEIFLEVNLGGEENKAGFMIEEFGPAVDEVKRLESVEVSGLMVIPPAGPTAAAARRWFVQARELRDHWLPGHALSMGMSGDFEVAIEEGASVVRVGSAIFGSRPKVGS
jgi:pyridoxal phosphate enzyme (YggS family)